MRYGFEVQDGNDELVRGHWGGNSRCASQVCGILVDSRVCDGEVDVKFEGVEYFIFNNFKAEKVRKRIDSRLF